MKEAGKEGRKEDEGRRKAEGGKKKKADEGR